MEAATSNSGEKENPLNLTTARLSDVDDISDIDIEDVADELHKTMTAKPAYNERRRSIFNTTLDLTESRPACQQLDVAVYAYQKHVVREKQSWESFITRNLPRPGALRTTSTSYKPSQDQQAYLNEGPNLQTFIRGLGAFMNDSSSFLIEFDEMQDLQEDVKDCCQYHVYNIQRNNIGDYLARS